ncbi:cell division protein FtsL [Inquilinus sp. CA228]
MIWLGLIGASSAFLFKTSYEVQSLEGDLRGLNRSILREQDSIRVMHAEWAFLNQPSRLQALTDQFTKLRPIAPTQMVASAADLPMPLPSLDGEPMAPTASLVAQIDALPSVGPVPLPGHRPGEGGILLAAAAPMPVQIPAVSPQVASLPAAAPVQMAVAEVRPAPAVAPAPVSAPPVARVATGDVPIRPVVAPRRPAAASLEAVAQALAPTRAAASDDPIGALLSGLEAPRGIR